MVILELDQFLCSIIYLSSFFSWSSSFQKVDRVELVSLWFISTIWRRVIKHQNTAVLLIKKTFNQERHFIWFDCNYNGYQKLIANAISRFFHVSYFFVCIFSSFSVQFHFFDHFYFAIQSPGLCSVRVRTWCKGCKPLVCLCQTDALLW